VNVTWLFAAFLAAWVIIGVYVFSIATRQRRLEERFEELDRSAR
jgi:CcmD family protein